MSPRREEEAEAEVKSGQPGANQANNVEPDGYTIAVDHGFSRGAVVWGGWAVVGHGKPVRGRDRDHDRDDVEPGEQQACCAAPAAGACGEAAPAAAAGAGKSHNKK